MSSTSVQGSTVVAAAPEAVWALVSDLPGMGRLSPEATGGRWVKGGGPVVGAAFRGTNAQGRRRWSTTSTVVEAEPGRRFAFEVSAFGMAVARWTYELEPVDGGCRVTETWVDRRGALLRSTGGLVTGESDRAAYTRTSIDHTLGRLKAALEG